MESLKHYPISLLETLKARSTISQYFSPSPLIRYENLSRYLNCNISIKHENHNPTGSFKIRGGINIMSHIKRRQIKGVVTFSTGSHGLSVGTSAKLFNIPSVIVVPNNTNPAKIQLIKDTGADVIEAGNNFDEAAQVVARLNEERGYYYVHPANEPLLINGVGTEFLEIIEKLPDIDAIILPLGGGSEVAAAITTMKALKPEIEIYAVQAQASNAAYFSWKTKAICTRANKTFAGGFATGSAYETTFNIYKNTLTDFILLEEEEILRGIALAAHYTHNMVEGAGSSTLMAAWKLKERLAGKNVVLQFSGANASYTEIQKAYHLSALETGEFSEST
ncbi:threonine ammonia-lyase [Celerinatantimonas diazotrophica]|uniref:Threonine dehydratase n=1 Tax=Celerinatantimonas diazotrophica TaxID=412034 RepID=A0A4R1K253_9GAMM|nr:threonine/serine dehydratase [Celerinatantimonas diazotrophica]TCK58096.1 threonine dehydratase [Celerinatantimonas diazotrophica]CAG9297832.1 L-threonine ammonia-lyase [Celerinatantimonas diazotrophica]